MDKTLQLIKTKNEITQLKHMILSAQNSEKEKNESANFITYMFEKWENSKTIKLQ